MESEASETNSGFLAGDRLFPEKDLSFLISRQWWQFAFKLALRYAHHCVKPAALLAGGHILMLSALVPVHAPVQLVDPSLELMMAVGIGALLVCLVGLFLSLWGLTLWLRNLSAFTHACLTNNSVPNEEAYARSFEWVKSRQPYINKLWLYGSIFVLLPMLPPAFLLAFKVLFSWKWLQLGVPPFQLPQWGYFTVSFICSAISFSYMFTLLVLSVNSKMTPGATAGKALLQSLLCAPQLAVTTAVVLFFGCVICAPHALLIGTPIPDMVLQNLWFAIIVQLWLSVTSCVIWPLSVLPYCRLAGWQPE